MDEGRASGDRAKPTVAVIGLGYIGLPTSAVLASRGIRVKGVDVNPHYVAEINAGRIPIVEPDLDVVVAGAVATGHLTAGTEVPSADFFVIAVPTPFHGDHEPDISYVRAATESIAPRLEPGNVVILESTAPPGTTRQISEWLAALRPDLSFPHDHADPDVHVAHGPERVLPGRIMIELVTNDRIVGGLTPECASKAAELYRNFCEGEILLTDATSAEMAKLTENSFRDVNIAFANELANVCDTLGVDVWEVIRLANRHPRVNILQPGPGVGGHCIAVDPWFIVAAAPQQAGLIRRAREVNDGRPTRVVAEALEHAAQDDRPVACLGLAFKANVDDLRESPALAITVDLARQLPDREVLAVEPHVGQMPASAADLPNLRLTSLEDALSQAGTVVLLVDHAAFADVRAGDLEGRQVIDTRGVWRSLTR